MSEKTKRERIERGIYFEPATGLYMARVGSGLPKPHETVTGWFRTKEAARAWRATSADNRANGLAVAAPPHPTKHRRTGNTNTPTTFAQFAQTWLEREQQRSAVADASEGRRRSGALRPSTLAGYEMSLRTHLLPRFGKRAMRDITTSDVEQWVTSLAAAGYARRTQDTLLRLLRQLFNDAVTNNTGGVTRNPAYKVKPVTPAAPRLVRERKRAKKRILSWVEVRNIAACLPVRLRPLVWLQYALALRSGETFAVRIKHLSLTPSVLVAADRSEVKVAGFIDIQEQRNPRAELDYTKTVAGTRRVPLPEILVEYLASYIARHHGPDPDPDALLVVGAGVFKDEADGADPSNWPRVFYSACCRAGLSFTLEGDEGLPWKLTPHFGRSNTNGWLYKLGVDGRTRSDWLGHADDDDDGDRTLRPAALVTDQSYGGALDPAALARAARALDEAIRSDIVSLDPPADHRLTAPEVADLANMSRAGIYAAVSKGELRASKEFDVVSGREVFRFERADLQAFLQERGSHRPGSDEMTSAQVAELLGIDQVSAARMARDGVLPAAQVVPHGRTKPVWMFERKAVMQRAKQVGAGTSLPGMSVSQAAQTIGCNRSTMYRLIEAGEFPTATKVVTAHRGGVSTWRLDPDEVEAVAARWDKNGGGLDAQWGRARDAS